MHPLWAIGFRPFYLLAGACAALAVPLWTLQYTGWLPGGDLRWHAHEMLFGYAFAVITGFLFTAVRNWTGRPTPAGGALAAIAALWLAGRILAPFSLPAAAAAGAAFALAVAWGIGRPLVASGNHRNLVFVVLVLVLGAANVAFLSAPQWGIAVALDVVLLVMAVIAGRVLPMFTNNAVPGAGARRVAALEAGSLGALAAILVLDFLEWTFPLLPLAAAALHAARLALWRPHKTLGRPILWILHAAYAWIVAHLLLRGLAGLDLVPASLATHALTVGAIGGLTLGMMTRTARGHTGRPLVAGGAEIAAYALVQLAAAARVLLPLAAPQAWLWAVATSSILWSAAFAAFVFAYLPVLTRPRLDGQPG